MAGATGAASSLSGLAGALGPVGAAVGIAGSLYGIFRGMRQMKDAKKIKPVFNQYERSKYAEQMLGQAQSRLNAQDPYAAAQRRATLGSQANAMANMQNNTLDPAQALQMTAALQANTDNALFQQEQQNQQNYAQREANLYNAQNVNIAEDGKIYQSMMDKYQMDMSQKMALQNAGQQSIMGGISQMGDTFLGSAMMAKEGMFNLGNKSKSTGTASALTTTPNGDNTMAGMIYGMAKSGRLNAPPATAGLPGMMYQMYRAGKLKAPATDNTTMPLLPYTQIKK